MISDDDLPDSNQDSHDVDNRLLGDLRDRLAGAVARAAEHGNPTLGTVEVTIRELAELLDRIDHHQDQLMAREFAASRQAHHMRRKNAMLLSIELALVGQSGPLVDILEDILRGGGVDRGGDVDQ
ncbi:hypothetical protein RAJCM14343_1759 [Rhodococcus aetherivorans]|uniref:Uncharacterized protein n=1 Tax=Rhodococcus aetherivorans TaxID=191292 RepID=A0ABQ0YIX6_9NOCA|nr:hypothetical protein [Rhodococcus aetherivorans]ETT27677.1 hypothetical protein RR21198_1725 [Rhodococcus rhodochrous ATCC 21198]KDE11520.1 hypothetical protein N505_0125205 [Rhodococcus aetherivorans]GES36507.1 hypothetical protein RAJCM14343_1759 [Rhodococcus aetherivorans]